MRIALYHLSPHVSDAQASLAALAWAMQLNGEYAREWGMPPNQGPCVIVCMGRDLAAATGPTPPEGFDRRHVLFGQPQEAGELGDHGVDAAGHPYLRTFVDPVLDNGGTVLGDPLRPYIPSVTGVGSHENLEAGGDPNVNVWVDCPPGRIRLPSGKFATQVPHELSDPVESTQYALQTPLGVAMVSDFVTRRWFNPTPGPAGVKYSYSGSAPGPFALAQGGYCVGRSAGPGSEELTFGDAYQPGHVGPVAWRLELKTKARGRSFRRLTQARAVALG